MMTIILLELVMQNKRDTMKFNIEKRLEESLSYLYEMARKYDDLNSKTRGNYKWRQNAIYERIESLELLKCNTDLNIFDECYKEDLKESERS